MFLPNHDARKATDKAPAGISAHELCLGRGAMGLEVVVFTATRAATTGELKALHDDRKRGRASPVAIVVLWGVDRAQLCTHLGLEHDVLLEAERSQIERICDAALTAPDRHAAQRLLMGALLQLNAPVPGLRNAGLFAMHELLHGVPRRSDWPAARQSAEPLLALRKRELLGKLGFRVQSLPGPASVLIAAGSKIAVAVFLDRNDEIEPTTPLFDHLSPVSYALAKADEENLDYVVVAAGSLLRIYPVKPGVGTGRRGRTETYVELDLALLKAEHAAYLHLLASANALKPGGSFNAILGTSRDFAVALGERLRDRVYEDVIPQLADALVKARRLRSPSTEKLAETYEMALLVLFRLLFVAYAEDKELLPLHSSPSYQAHSLKEIAKRLAAERERNAEYGKGDHYWTEVCQLWKAVDQGNKAWNVPQYNGGLFASGDDASSAAQALGGLTLPDAVFAPALASLLLDETTEGGRGPVDFRSLGVREFGTIYEGLLEQELAVAEIDLSVDKKTGAYIPAKGKAAIVVPEGKIYLHNASGARKASGAYYTKDFAVEHLLEHALEPALADHLARVAATYDDRAAADQFFDFHVADIAMGSGHFLVAAIDHIERAFSGYLAKRRLPGVLDELERLRTVAKEALGEDYRGEPLEDTQLLRRQIARRCIFGVDLNPLAVELSRLSIWIHTFVAGLPLSFLDQNLVCGNALVGIATFDEARELLGADETGFFAESAEALIGNAREPLARLARLADATAAEVKEAKTLYGKARAAIQNTEDLFTILTASRIDQDTRPAIERRRATNDGSIGAALKDSLVSTRMDAALRKRLSARAERVLAGHRTLHFPVAFPQVFLGRRPGFDVILGNPPWEKAQVEEHEFWARHFVGFRGLTQAERERRWPAMRRARPDLVSAFDVERQKSDALRNLLLKGPYPGMGSGHPDLYKAFCWRFWHLVSANGGSIGVVLPRAVFAAKGSEEFRVAVFNDRGTADLATLVNNRGWVFENVHPQYSVTLTAIRKGPTARSSFLALRGPYYDADAIAKRRVAEAAEFEYSAVRGWNQSAALPLLPNEQSGGVFSRLSACDRFSADGKKWLARPLQGDINTTSDREWFETDRSPSARWWPVYAGESFDLWTPDTGKYYGAAEAGPLCEFLQEKRLRGARHNKSVFSQFSPRVLSDPRTLSCRHARIAFRDVSRATDSRTIRCALIPPKVFLVHTAPYLLWPKGEPRDEARLLGIMSSIPFDWYARRFVETHVTFELLSGFPLPSGGAGSRVEARVAELAARLATPDDRFEEWAAHFGITPAELAVDEKHDHIHELDAAVAHLYGLDERELAHIFETFHEGWDYEERLQRTLKHHRTLASRR